MNDRTLQDEQLQNQLEELTDFVRTIAQAGESGPLAIATWHEAKSMAKRLLQDIDQNSE